MFIDQLGMIQEKTRGNLSEEETAVLRNTLANLQMAFVEVSRNGVGGKPQPAPAPAGAPAPEVETAPPPPAAGTPETAPAPIESESRKKFTKSYGA